MKIPLVSVIIPTYNRETLLHSAISSVMAQIWRPLEIIVVDDGSTDKTPDVCHELIENNQDPAISLTLHQQTNMGVSAARNTGTRLASGEYIQYLDSDDMVHPQKIEMQTSFLQRHPECGLCLSSYLKGEAPPLTWPNLEAQPTAQPFFQDSRSFTNPQTASLLYRKSLIDQIDPWEEGFSMGEDLVFLLRALMASETIGIDQNKAVFFRSHKNERLTTNTSLKKVFDDLEMRGRLIDILGKAPLHYQQSLAGLLIPHMISQAKWCKTKHHQSTAKAFLSVARKLPLSRKQLRSINLQTEILILPNFVARLIYRLGLV